MSNGATFLSAAAVAINKRKPSLSPVMLWQHLTFSHLNGSRHVFVFFLFLLCCIWAETHILGGSSSVCRDVAWEPEVGRLKSSMD